jgi:pimeloyl-ACP methyl ester carboxylesterase
MATRFLLIPGTGAVDFTNAAGTKASYLVEIFTARYRGWSAAVADELSCEHPSPAQSPWAPTRTSLSGIGAALTPRDVLVASAYDVVSSKYEMFAYDWRLDIRYNASLLLDRMRQSPNDKWCLVTHSQGGLVALAASMMCTDAQEWHSHVHRMALVAPPLMGTMNAMDAIVRGSNFGNMNSEFFRQASRTWPAIFQMFPQFACVSNEPATRSTSASLWPGEGAPFMQLLQRAKEYMQWVGYNPFRHVEPGRLMVVLGRNPVPNTLVAATATAAGPLITTQSVRGDTLVPYDITTKHMLDCGVLNRLMKIEGATQPDHFRLLGDARVFKWCDVYLSGGGA